MTRDVCPTCGCCNYCESRHLDEDGDDPCPLDPTVSDAEIDKFLRRQGFDPEKVHADGRRIGDLAGRILELRDEVAQLRKALSYTNHGMNMGVNRNELCAHSTDGCCMRCAVLLGAKGPRELE